MLNKSIISFFLATGILFSGCSSQKNKEQDANAILSTNEFVLKDLTKNEYTIKKQNGGFVVDKQEGKILILDIFATWCPPCQAEATHLSHLQKLYKDDLIIIGVSVENDITDAELQEFRAQHDAQYPLSNAADNRRIINAVAKSLNVGNNFGIPLMAMYKDGKLIRYYQGATEEEFIESDIKRALGK